jgi:NAD-dependent dihydropyrimidine dehydrogenase PreA subunit
MPWFAGVTREEIDWGPSIDLEKCVSCGICLNCGKGVFTWANGKSLVERRDDCVAGCMTCANLCQGNAITFPPLADLRKTYRDHRIWTDVKKAMIAAGQLPGD